MDQTPEYSTYSLVALRDCAERIDKEKYPDRYAEIQRLLHDPNHLAEQRLQQQNYAASIKYSTFWPRVGAVICDGIIFAFVLYIECLLLGFEYSLQDKFLQACNSVQIAIYTIIMHGCYGQTLGKMLMDIKVVNYADETEIGVWQALRRESVTLVLNVLWTLIILFVALVMALDGFVPDHINYMVLGFTAIATFWFIAELLTMLLNKKRRSLQDFIGKTVVIRVNQTE
ncbi:MAG: RDD family protein [Pararheinheimera sp.]|nr:RDD family protein [Rheinheimera sp.]